MLPEVPAVTLRGQLCTIDGTAYKPFCCFKANSQLRIYNTEVNPRIVISCKLEPGSTLCRSCEAVYETGEERTISSSLTSATSDKPTEAEAEKPDGELNGLVADAERLRLLTPPNTPQKAELPDPAEMKLIFLKGCTVFHDPNSHTISIDHGNFSPFETFVCVNLVPWKHIAYDCSLSNEHNVNLSTRGSVKVSHIWKKSLKI